MEILVRSTMLPLGLLNKGESAQIAGIRHRSGEGSEARMEDLGVRVGKEVKMLNNGGGPLLIKIGESRIAIARTMAMNILVRRREE
jgi:ferrous iron transport protein A